jgi:hypothetical protein
MSLDLARLKENVSQSLCGDVEIVETREKHLLVDTPFSFPDGDIFQVYIEQGPAGGLHLTDFGHTWMRLSYDNETAKFRDGSRRKILDQILAQSGMKDLDGKFVLDCTPENVGSRVLAFGQALTRVYDLTFLNRERVADTFYEDLNEMVRDIVPSAAVHQDYTLPGHEDAEQYPIDFWFEGNRSQVMLLGIPHRDKARLATIILQHWMSRGEDFDSLLVFQNQQDIPRNDLARLSNVGGEQIASLTAGDDFRRKLKRYVKMENN